MKNSWKIQVQRSNIECLTYSHIFPSPHTPPMHLHHPLPTHHQCTSTIPPPPHSNMHTDSSLLLSADYTLCLDSLSARQSQLFLHVSKPPREDSRAFQLVQALNQVSGESCMAHVNMHGHLEVVLPFSRSSFPFLLPPPSPSLSLFLSQSAQYIDPDFHVNLVHKKIRLSEDLLAWEHERFSLKKLPAATLSGLRSPKDFRRRSMFVHRLVHRGQTTPTSGFWFGNKTAQFSRRCGYTWWYSVAGLMLMLMCWRET